MPTPLLPMTPIPFQFSDPNLDDKEKLRELATFVKGCSHLLQNNSKKLATYADFIQDELEDNPRAQDFFDQADQILQTIQLLANLLDPQDDIRLEGEPIPVRPMLNGVVNRASTLFAKQKIAFELNCQEGLNAYGDVLQLQQLVFSIIDRMVTSGTDTQCIMIDAQDVSLSDSELKRWGADCRPGNYLEVTIHLQEHQDLSPKTFTNLTEAFTAHGHEDVPKTLLATWLGVLRRHGGDLLLNTPNATAAFKLLIAKSYAKQPLTPQPQTENTTPRGNETILLVDDEDMIWDLVIDTLSSLGYTVLLAGDGQDAIDTYTANPGTIDLVIMDMVMPGMNGREAFQQLKKVDPNVKVLLSSGYVSDEDARFVMQAGALGFLRKPYSMKKLGQTVREILDRT